MYFVDMFNPPSSGLHLERFGPGVPGHGGGKEVRKRSLNPYTTSYQLLEGFNTGLASYISYINI